MESSQATEVKEGTTRKRRRLYEPLNDGATAEDTQATTADVPEANAERYAKAMHVINKHVCWSAGVGLIPIPVLDVAALTGVDLKMISELCKVYNVPFSESRAKSIVAALIGSISATSIRKGVLGVAFWMVPMIGPALYLLLSPCAAGASTFAIGRVFVQHYELGGTLLSFNPDDTKAFFAEQFKAGKEFVSQMGAKN